MTEKPENPLNLDETGRALLATLDQPQSMFIFDPAAPWNGEPLALPAGHYKEEQSPMGWTLLGWRLTDSGIAAWEAGR